MSALGKIPFRSIAFGRDRELFTTKGELKGETFKQAFNELTALYHAGQAHSMPIRPPVIP